MGTLINPRPTPEQELQRLALTVGSLVCATLLWDILSDGERERLGGDCVNAFQRHGGAVGMYRKLSGMPPHRAVLDVAVRIELIGARDYARLAARLDEGETTLEARVSCAVCTHTMVLVPEQRVFYFDGKRVDLSTRAREWRLVELLAKRAPQRRLVDPEDIREGVQRGDYLSKMLSRMTNRPGFPLGFSDLIRSPNRDGRLVLDLNAEQICVISSSG